MIQKFKDFDRIFFLFLNQFHHESLNPIMEIFSGQLIWIPLIGAILIMAQKKLTTKQLFIFILLLALTIIASDVTSSSIIKNLAQRLRPCRIDDLKMLIYNFGQRCGGRFGFVSSHAANSSALITFSLVALDLKFKRFWPAYLAPLIVGYSRIYLGVHFPGDVFFGNLIGVICGLMLGQIFLLNIYGASRNRSQP